MFVTSEDLSPVYIISLDEIKKIVPSAVQRFEEKAEEILVILRLTYDYKFSIKDILEHCAVDDLEGSKLYKVLTDEDYHALEGKFKEAYDLLIYEKGSVLEVFREKTGVKVTIEYDYDDFDHNNHVYFCIGYRDAVEYNPSMKALKDSGLKIYFGAFYTQH
jgi:hypothetical protein